MEINLSGQIDPYMELKEFPTSVLCLDNEMHEDEVTIGKIYQVRWYTDDIMNDGHCIGILNDKCLITEYSTMLFMPADDFKDRVYEFRRGTSMELISGLEVVQMFGEWKEFHRPEDLLKVLQLKPGESESTDHPVLSFTRMADNYGKPVERASEPWVPNEPTEPVTFNDPSLLEDINAGRYSAYSALGYTLEQDLHNNEWELSLQTISISELEGEEEGILDDYYYNTEEEAQADIEQFQAVTKCHLDKL
jgi:hypothetical protein